MIIKRIDLDWRGCYIPFQSDQNAINELEQFNSHGVYAWLYTNKLKKTGIYFGFSNNVHARILEHCKKTLGGYYVIPKEESTIYQIKDDSAQINDLSKVNKLSIKKNTEYLENSKFYFANVDHNYAGDTERALILAFEEICKIRQDTYFSCNTGLQGCKKYTQDLEILNDGAKEMLEIFNKRLIKYTQQKTNLI